MGCLNGFAAEEIDPLFILTIQPRPASQGKMLAWISCPYRAILASRRSVLRAPRPHGLIPNSAPAAKISFHKRAASDGAI